MNRQNALARSLSLLAVALLLFTSFACLLGTSDIIAGTVSGGGINYSESNLYKEGTVFNNHVSSYTSLGSVRDIATGHLDKDSNIDVAVATATQIKIYYGNGDGSLGGPFTVQFQMRDIRKIAVGDLDKDGLDDIAATYYEASDNTYRVGIFYQKDNFSGSLSQNPTTYYDPWQVIIGDFNNTGENCLAVICKGDSSIGKLTGLLIIKWPYAGSTDNLRFIELTGLTNLKLLAAGYVNSDNRPDLVVGDAYGSTIVVLTQPDSSTSPWTSVTKDIGGSIADIQFTDYSGSGLRKDLVVVKSGQDSNQVEIHVNNGNIPASASTTLTVNGASSLAVGSVTGASSPDLGVLSNLGNIARLYPYGASGLVASSYFQIPVNTGAIKAVATNGGVYVLSTGNLGALEFYRYMDSTISNADGSRFVTAGQPSAVCAGDVSFGIIATAYNGQNAVYISNLSGDYRVINTSGVPTSLYIGDLDGDGIGDLAIAFLSLNTVSIYKGSSSFMSNNAPVTISLSLTRPQSLTGGMIGAIGKDVLIVGCQSGIDIIYNSISGSPTQETIGTSYPGDRTDIAFGRISPTGADGGIAVLNSYTYGPSVEVYYVKQSPTIGDCYDSAYNARLSLSGDTPISLAIGDFNGNSKDDIAVLTAADTSGYLVNVFINAGSSISTSPSAFFALSGTASQVRSADLNDDGKDDLAIRFSSIPTIGIWLSKSSSSFSNSFNFTAGGVASGLFIGDFNGDQRDDILASSSSSGTISYWLQNDLVPMASIWLSSSAIDKNNFISFDASNSTDSFSDRSSLTYYWDFGDGNTSTEKAAKHLYTVAGSYTGHFSITDRSGLTGRSDFVITVNNPLKAAFNATSYTAMVGSEIYVWDVSDAPNGIRSLSWDIGDGSTSSLRDVTVIYSRPGVYTITLTVTDKAGKVDTASHEFTILPASSTINGIVASGGKTTFYMDQEVDFEVIANDSSLSTAHYAWDMDYLATSSDFIKTSNISINQARWSYHVPGEHTICVMIYGSETSMKTLTIYILNSRPVPNISASVSNPGNYTFDAGGSSDNVTDMNAGLEYRWNFGNSNEWTGWTNNPIAQYDYTVEGTFTVTLEVKDQWGLDEGGVNSTTYLAIADFTPPIIDLDQSTMVSHAYRGEDLVIKVNVTDLTGVERVLLVYTSNNETKTLVMSRISGTDTYVATIPAEDVTGDLSYYIDAVDGYDNHSPISAMTINLTDRPNDFLMYVILAAVAALGAIFLVYYRSASMVVDDVFIIYEDGNMMAHQTRRLKPGMDDQVLGSMLVAIQNFVKDSFKDEASTGLNRMDFGEQKVLVEKGEHIYMAVVLHGKREGRVPQRMREAIAKAESTYSQALEGWDGDLEKVRGIKDETNPLLKSSLKDFMSAIPFIGRESAGPVKMTTCQFCFTSFPAGEPKCPKCGTVPDKKPPTEGAGEGGGQAS